MKKNENDISEEVLALVGRIVSELLRKDGAVVPENLTGELQNMIEYSSDEKIRKDCSKVLARLMKKMH